VSTPLVLHGGSGLTDEDFRKCIEMGISKVNIFTDINIAAVAAALAHFTDMGKGIIDLLPSIRDAIKVSVSEKMQLFGCCGKAGGVAGVPDEAMIRRIVEEVLRSRRG